MIVVIDTGTGNLRSVVRALRRVGAEALVSTAVGDVEAADKIVLPGVGAAGAAMAMLCRQGLVDVLNHKVLEQRTPILGICLGLHLLARSSEEGDGACLGWVAGRAVRLRPPDDEPDLKIPHLGWNTAVPRRPSPLFDGLADDACFYFAHSYCVQCDKPELIAAETTYGVGFVSAVWADNIFGVQFHPEKSHANGLQVLRNFVHYC